MAVLPGMTLLNIKIRIALSIDGQSIESPSFSRFRISRRLMQAVARKMLDPEIDRWKREGVKKRPSN